MSNERPLTGRPAGLVDISALQENLTSLLHSAAERLRGTELPHKLALRMERLAAQVHQPCVVAVVGRVKVGKSTFVNALLGGDYAKAGTTETTATINYFSYGEPGGLLDAERPVRCHWRGGTYSDVSRDFLDDLQGNDLKTLQKAERIDHLEYFLPNRYLKQITLVDTPGTGAVIDTHQNRTAEFMQLNNQLRTRHDRETRELNDTADAVIYLVGQVAMAPDESFLKEFRETTGRRSSALNAIGVLSKIELQPEILARRCELSAKIASELKENLNTVLPVAAGLRRVLDSLLEDERAGLRRMVSSLRRIPPARLEMLLDSDEFFRNLDLDDCPLGPAERRELLGNMNWAVFTTIARVAADPELDINDVVRRLDEICGFQQLKQVLDDHFIKRGRILRCYGIASKATKVLEEIKFTHLPALQKDVRRDEERLDRFLTFIRDASGERMTAGELEDFVRTHLDASARVREVETLLRNLGLELGTLFHELLEHNEDFGALKRLGDSNHRFSPVELDELQHLLGQYGGDIDVRLRPGAVSVDYVAERQLYWGRRRGEAPYGTVEHAAADRAYTRYGLILNELLGRS